MLQRLACWLTGVGIVDGQSLQQMLNELTMFGPVVVVLCVGAFRWGVRFGAVSEIDDGPHCAQ